MWGESGTRATLDVGGRLAVPFKSRKQMKYLYANHPEIAKRWSMEAKRSGKPAIRQTRKARKR